MKNHHALQLSVIERSSNSLESTIVLHISEPKHPSAKHLSDGSLILPESLSVLSRFLEPGRKRKIDDGKLIKYQPNYCVSKTQAISLHQLVFQCQEKYVDTFFISIQIVPDLTEKVEKDTREQLNSRLWFELRYGRITASRAFDVSRRKTNRGTYLYP